MPTARRLHCKCGPSPWATAQGPGAQNSVYYAHPVFAAADKARIPGTGLKPKMTD